MANSEGRKFGAGEGGVKSLVAGNSFWVRALVFVIMSGAFLLFLRVNDVSHPAKAAADSSAVSTVGGANGEEAPDSAATQPASTTDTVVKKK